MKKLNIKVVIIGNANVGKTSLMQRYVQSNFSNQYKATIGAEFLSKEILMGDRVVTMQIWDTAGQEKYQSVQGVFYRGSDGCVLVYDITNIESFQALKKWKEEFLNAANVSNPDTFPFVLVGNKADMVTERKVAYAKASQWCKENGGLFYIETSAKTANNVKEMFEEIARKAVEAQKGRLEIGGVSKINVVKRLTLSEPEKKENCQC